MSAHTPIPWIFTRRKDPQIVDCIAHFDGPEITVVCDFKRTPKDADARLIVLSPVMLDALKMAEMALVNLGADESPMCYYCPGSLEAVRAVIAEVEGGA